MHSCSLRVEGQKVFAEFIFEIDPIKQVQPPISGSGFILEFPGGPVTGLPGLHVRHCPDDFDGVIFEGFQA
jgi:hypothetical protein